MMALLNAARKLTIWKDTRGQDLTEYALMGGFLAATCGAALPGIAVSITTIFSKVVAMLGSSGVNTAAPI